jgi:uncharacterized protein (DUF2249 family)
VTITGTEAYEAMRTHHRILCEQLTDRVSAVSAAVVALADGEELVVLAPFEPVPLEGVLGSQGFSYEAADLGDGDWQVTFRREP